MYEIVVFIVICVGDGGCLVCRVGWHAHDSVSECSEILSYVFFGQNVCLLVDGWYVSHDNEPSIDQVPRVVVLHVYVFGSVVMYGVFCE